MELTDRMAKIWDRHRDRLIQRLLNRSWSDAIALDGPAKYCRIRKAHLDIVCFLKGLH